MGYAVYWVDEHERFAGYGVPCICEQPGCNEKINRGLGCLCGETPGTSEDGCGLYFCGKHLYAAPQQCERCRNGLEPFKPKPDTREWMRHMMRDKTWKQWRDENPKLAAHIKQRLSTVTETPNGRR